MNDEFDKGKEIGVLETDILWIKDALGKLVKESGQAGRNKVHIKIQWFFIAGLVIWAIKG